ncbi:MAG: signal peptidase I [Myxococcales bacterium]|nr:signal peptidase I [Myxococcales bacterium]
MTECQPGAAGLPGMTDNHADQTPADKTPDDAKTSDKRKRRRGSYARTLIPVVLVALLFRAFVAEAYMIPSESMYPGLQVGDRIVATKLDYGLSVPFTTKKLTAPSSPTRGDIVTFIDPRDGETVLIKRVIAVGGDRVALRGGRVFVNGRALPRAALTRSCHDIASTKARRYLPTPCRAFVEKSGAARYIVFDDPSADYATMLEQRVPKGHLFMMGDNRPRSADSRVWGTVPLSHLRGRARVILWSYLGVDGVRWKRFFSALK